ncbi:MAG: phosphoenolpyruvate--protein phosphotransferase [Verrucomicrobia bacterium]|jgi:phosphotransferase system enzyme I (PtsI)|nr:MAG: phosphoenolpyruvate--protein phosphotransferase [Verrucomicrobiota bacterium]
MAERLHTGETIIRGIPVSAGVCKGKILILDKSHHTIEHRAISETEVAREINRFQHALVQTREQLLEVQRQLTLSLGPGQASIFDAHLLVLEDPSLIDEVVRVIEQKKVNAEHAFHTVTERYSAALAKVEDDYLRERAADMRDVSARVLNHLLGGGDPVDLGKLSEPCIIISHDLTPSKTAQIDRKNVLGFATEIGSRTSHTAIMARSFRIPAIVGLKNASEVLQNGDYALLDGFNGVLIINPTDQTLFEYGVLVRKQDSLEEKLRDALQQPAITLDNHRVFISANIEQATDAERVKNSGAEGVGLFRTEYLFINRELPPNEEEQYQAYRQAAETLKPDPLVIRTLDLGGDKLMSSLAIPHEMNPFLGWRAIRYCLQHEEIFRAQLRAILRASVVGNIKIMYPMISGLDELTQANAFVAQYKIELRKEGIPFDDKIEVGAMIETPSAALITDALAKRVQFFSLGTNDLIQYTLAVDRMNEKIAHLYEPTHPAIVRLIKRTVDAARQQKVWVSVCGEMAGDTTLVPLLIGLGVDELSAAPPLLAQIKFLVRRLKLSDTQELAAFALESESATEILSRSVALAQRAAPSLFDTKK